MYDGGDLPSDELDGGRFWTPGEIRASLGKGVFTPISSEAALILEIARHEAARILQVPPVCGTYSSIGPTCCSGWLGVTSDTGGWDRWIAFLLVLLFVVLFDFACRLVIVRGVRRLVARTRAVWDDTLFSVRVLRCACHILSAVLLAVVLPIVFEGVPACASS